MPRTVNSTRWLSTTESTRILLGQNLEKTTMDLWPQFQEWTQQKQVHEKLDQQKKRELNTTHDFYKKDSMQQTKEPQINSATHLTTPLKTKTQGERNATLTNGRKDERPKEPNFTANSTRNDNTQRVEWRHLLLHEPLQHEKQNKKQQYDRYRPTKPTDNRNLQKLLLRNLSKNMRESLKKRLEIESNLLVEILLYQPHVTAVQEHKPCKMKRTTFMKQCKCRNAH